MSPGGGATLGILGDPGTLTPISRVSVFQELLRSLVQSSHNKTDLIFFIFLRLKSSTN